MWNRKQHQRFLPTLPEYFAMQVAAPAEKRTPQQRRFLRCAGQKHFLQTVLALAVILPIGLVAISSVRQRWQNAEDHRKRIEETIFRGDVGDFVALFQDLHNDREILSSTSRPWLNSTNEKHRIRTRLLSTALDPTSFKSLVNDLGKIEPQLSKQVIEIASHCSDAKPLLFDVIKESTKLEAEDVRAAVLLACLGNSEHVERMLDDRNSPSQTNLFFRYALEWDADPQLWINLALSKKSPAGVIYYSLCLLGSYPDTDLPSDLPWRDIDDLQASQDAGVSAAAKWLLEKSPTSKGQVDPARSASFTGTRAQHRVLGCGLEQVKIDAGRSNRPILLTRIELKNPKIQVDEQFWISNAAVANAEFEIFLKEFESAEHPDIKTIERSTKRDTDLEFNARRSVTGLNARLVLMYCNWLSRREDLVPAYAIESEGFTTIEGASGFRLPTVAQIAYAAEFGRCNSPKAISTEKTISPLAVQAFHKSKVEPLNQLVHNRFEISRFTKSLMPNRAGIHFDMEASDCLALEGTQVCIVGITQDGYIAFPPPFNNPFDNPLDLSSLWLVSECHDVQP